MAVKFSVERFKGKLHYHGCTHCHIRYTCACKKPADDDMCGVCLTGHGHSLQRGLLPHPCCFHHCRTASSDERQLYKLVGPGPWFICRKCYRQFTAYPGEPS